jgi:hypothetical protein
MGKRVPRGFLHFPREQVSLNNATNNAGLPG